MNQYNIFQAFYLSFFSRNLYRDVAARWGGKSFIYLLLMVSLSWIYPTYLLQTNLNRGYQYNSSEFVVQIPVLSVTNGKVTTPEKRPYLITEPNTKETVAIIDTSGKYKTLEQAKTSLLITQTSVISKNDRETKIYELPANLNTVINPPVINNYIKDFIGFAWIPFFILVSIFSFFYNFVVVLVYSIIGKIFNLILGTTLSYAQVMQITMVARTPTIILASLLSGFHIIIAGSIYFILSMAYLFYGDYANKN